MTIPRITSPRRRNPRINELLSFVGSPHEPIQVPVQLDGQAGLDQLFQCYLVVRDRVERDGGSMRCGWLIAQSDIMYQAQHHAVWSPSNDPSELICITPKVIRQDEVMFVPDDRYPYRDKDIPNYRISEPISSVVDDLILVERIRDVFEAQFPYKNDREQDVPEHFKEHYRLIKQMRQEWIKFISFGGRLTSPCFCGKQRIYRDCHGLDMRGKADALLSDYGLSLDWMP